MILHAWVEAYITDNTSTDHSFLSDWLRVNQLLLTQLIKADDIFIFVCHIAVKAGSLGMDSKRGEK